MMPITWRHSTYLYILLGGLSLIVAGLAIAIILLPQHMQSKPIPASNQSDSTVKNEHLEQITTLPNEFRVLNDYFLDISKELGGKYGFMLLREAELPPNTDIHLLGHTVGDILYTQEGIDGMKYCTHEFRNACSHSIVIGGLLENGLGIFDHIHEACSQAPGGSGAYTMCFHGFGHGVLAYTDYNLPEAVDLCKMAGTKQHQDQEYHQCVGGVMMELHSGVHDQDVWAKNGKKYINFQNPVEMCERDYIETGAKRMCYSYLSPYIFDAAGWQQGNLTDDVVRKSFSMCGEVPETKYQRICSASLGKEFIVLAEARDIRNIDNISEQAINKTIQWCSLAPSEPEVSACLQETTNSLYWGGENHYDSSIRFCSAIETSSLQNNCFRQLFDNAKYYRKEPAYWEEICAAVPAQQQTVCSDVLLQ